MEARYLLSAMGLDGALRLRRGTLYFLSAGILDAWGFVGRSAPLEDCPRSLHVDRADAGGRLHVLTCTKLGPPTRFYLCCHAVRGEPLSHRSRLLAQCVCPASCQCLPSFACALHFA